MRTSPVPSLRPLIVGWLIVGGYCLAIGLGPAVLAAGVSSGESRLTSAQGPASLASNASAELADLAAPRR